MNYTLNQLQVYLIVVQTQSVTKAAEALNITQPAVAIQLKNCHDLYGVPII
ncbi:MAG: helix-turn-helix domain-containing protein, partial [Sediminibacterium sp.]